MRNNHRRVIAYILILSLTAMLCNSLAYAKEEEKKTYAAATFGTNIVTENLKITNNGMTPVWRDGREGISTISSSWKMEVWMDVDDDFISNLPEHTQVAVTVDYYDGNGKFCVLYDSYNPLYYSEYTNVGAWQQTETIYMENTNTWKSYTFILDDYRANNSVQSGMVSDIRLAAVDPISRVYPAEDVVFGKIKIEYVDDKNMVPVVMEKASSKYYGNIFSADEPVELNLECLNILDEDVEVKTKYTVYNEEEDEPVATGEIETEFSAKEQKNVPLKIENPGIYGTYSVKLEFEQKKKSSLENTIKNEKKTEFSVANVFNDGTVNNLMGSMEHFVNFYKDKKHYGEAVPIAEVQSRAGMGMMRGEFSRAMSYSNGKYVLADGAVQRMKDFADNSNIDTLVVLNQYMEKYAHGDMPDTPERYAEFAQTCADTVEQLKGITNYFEIWNEPNITFGNKNLAPVECYVEMCKAAYAAIKKVNPDAVVLVGATAASASSQTTLDIEWHEKAFEAGLADYMDGVSFHPYEWSTGFRDRRFIQGFTDLREMMNKYGAADKQIWVTEFGFASNADGKDDIVHKFTEKEQYQMTVLSYQLVKSMNLADVFIYYKFCDGWGRSHGNRWGWVRPPEYHKTFDHVEYAAKKVYIAMTAANRFLGVNTEILDFIQDVNEKSSTYATYGYNTKTGKNIVMLQSTSENKSMNFDFGCKSIEMYDAYGNKVDTIHSESGIFTFTLDKDPVYLEGNITNFKQTDTAGTVVSDTIVKDAATGDTVIFNFVKNSDKQLTISVDGADVVQNDGFADNKAMLKLAVPSDSEDTMECHIRVSDNDGNIYYSAKHFVNIKKSIVLSCTAEQYSADNVDRWQVRATVKNIANEKSITGEIKITSPEEIASQNKPRKFIDLEPNGEIVYIFNLPKQINKNVLDLEMVAETDDGQVISTKEKVCFSAAAYAYNKPVIDGKVDVNEWTGSWIGANEGKDYVQLLSPWRGAEDLSFSGTMLWDEDNFYFLAIVTDDVYYINHQPGGVQYTHNGDGIQIGIDDRVDVNSVETAVFNELNVGEVPGVGPVVYKQKAFYANSPKSTVLENAKIGIKRYDGYTVYECMIPWDDIFYADYQVNPDNKMRFSVMANDNDGAGRKGLIQYTGGIGTVKNVMEFGMMTLNKK